MKKLLLTIAALLLGLLAHSQEADGLGKYAEVTLVARAEYSSVEGDNLGNSSFYALLDGAFSPKLSYSVATHLLSSAPADLYTGTGYSNTTNWLDWAYMNYDFGSFNVQLGKDMLSWGTFEMQEYDFDQYYELTSYLWNEMPIYQWGAKLGWTPGDVFSLTANIASSPFMDRPYQKGCISYGFQAGVETDGIYSGLLSFNSMKYDFGSIVNPIGQDMITTKGWANYLNMGHKLSFEQVDLVWDSSYIFNEEECFCTSLSANYSPLEKLSFMGRGGVEFGDFYGGLVVNYYPIESLRLHAVAAYHDGYADNFSFNIGATWQITL